MPWTASSGRGVRPSPVSTRNKDAPVLKPGRFYLTTWTGKFELLKENELPV